MKRTEKFLLSGGSSLPPMGLHSQSERGRSAVTTASKDATAPRRATPTVIVEPQRSAWVYNVQPPTGPIVYVPRPSPVSPCLAIDSGPSGPGSENTRSDHTECAIQRRGRPQHVNETHAQESLAACNGRSVRRVEDEPSGTHHKYAHRGGRGNGGGDGRRPAHAQQGWERGRALDAPRWELGERCGCCCVAFTLFHPRHHCRNCGHSVCGKHSSHRFPLPHYGMADFMRVCDECHASLVTAHFRELAHGVFRANSADGAAACVNNKAHHHHHHHRHQQTRGKNACDAGICKEMADATEASPAVAGSKGPPPAFPIE